MTTTAPDSTRSNGTPIGGRDLVTAPIDPWTYRSLAYLLVGFPLAILYFTVVVTGVAITAGSIVTVLGPIAFVATLLSILALAWLDGAVTEGLLEAEVTLEFPDSEAGLVAFLEGLVLGRETWLGAIYLVWKTALGFVAFVGVVVALSVAASLLLAPLYYGEGVVVGWYQVDSFGRALVAAGGGLTLGYLTLVAVNLAGRLSRIVAEGLLGAGE